MSDAESHEASNILRDALLSEDDIGKVIRTHLYIESLVNNFVSISVTRPDHIKPMKLDYFGTVHLALATGLTEDLKAPLLQIGTLRNAFAHRPNQALDKNRTKNFFESFTPDQRSEMLRMSRDSALSWSKDGTEWRDVSPHDQFVVMATSLYYMLKIELSAFTHSLKLRKLDFELGQLTRSSSHL